MASLSRVICKSLLLQLRNNNITLTAILPKLMADRFSNSAVFFQLTYSMTRFAIYETAKDHLTQDGKQMPFYQKVLLGGVAGASGGLVGTPADMVNVR